MDEYDHHALIYKFDLVHKYLLIDLVRVDMKLDYVWVHQHIRHHLIAILLHYLIRFLYYHQIMLNKVMMIVHIRKQMMTNKKELKKR
jgi:hypothetical protein